MDIETVLAGMNARSWSLAQDGKKEKRKGRGVQVLYRIVSESMLYMREFLLLLDVRLGGQYCIL